MARVARKIDYTRIRRLQEQIDDPEYVEGAVERLAGRITDRILGLDGAHPTLHRAERSSKNDIARLLMEEE